MLSFTVTADFRIEEPRPEVEAHRKLIEEFCRGEAPGEHYLVTFEVFHEDDCDWAISPDGRMWSFYLRHPLGCEPSYDNIGDGLFYCAIGFEVQEMGNDAFGIELIENWGHPPFETPVHLVAETRGYFEPEYEAWVEKGPKPPPKSTSNLNDFYLGGDA